MVQEATPSQDTQLSFATTGPILQNEQFFSQVPQAKISIYMPSIYNLVICQIFNI